MESITLLDVAKKLYPKWFEHEKLIDAMRSLGGSRDNLASLGHTDEDPEVIQLIMQIHDLLEKIENFDISQRDQVADFQRALETVENNIAWNLIVNGRPLEVPNIRPRRDVPIFEDEDSDADEKIHDDASRNLNVFEANKKRSYFRDRILYEAVISGSIKTKLQEFLDVIKFEGMKDAQWVVDMGIDKHLAELGLDLSIARNEVLLSMEERIRKHRNENTLPNTHHDSTQEDDLTILGRAEREEQLRIESELLERAKFSGHDPFEIFKFEKTTDAKLRRAFDEKFCFKDEALRSAPIASPRQHSPNICDSESTAVSPRSTLAGVNEPETQPVVGVGVPVDLDLSALALSTNVAFELTVCVSCSTFGYSVGSCFCDDENSSRALPDAAIVKRSRASTPASSESIPLPFHGIESCKKSARDWYLTDDDRRAWKSILWDEQGPYEGPLPAPSVRHGAAKMAFE